MLIIRAFVNEKQIDEIYIQNVRIVDPDHPDGLCEYKIIKPEQSPNQGEYSPIFHRREDGWQKLAWSALGRIIRRKKVLEVKS